MPVSYGRGRRLTTLFGGLLRGQYFVNTETGESTWDHPAQLAGGASARQWALRVSKSTGDTYYFNSTTGESCWDAPPGVDEDFKWGNQAPLAGYKWANG